MLYALRDLRALLLTLCTALVSGVFGGGPLAAQNLQPAQGLDNPVLAFNLSAAHDYNPGFQFLDLMKIASPWIGHKPGQWGGMSWLELKSGGYLDAQGWLRALPPEVEKVGTLWRWGENPEPLHRKRGTYVLRYEGAGEIKLKGDARIISRRPGEILFENREGGTFMLDILTTDPKKTGDYIRNITLLREEHRELAEVGAVFHPDWLAHISDARHLRFMDWLETNKPEIVTWEESPSAQGPASQYGPALAHMVQLANEIGADPWFTMPHTVDDEYIRSFATYIRDHLDPNLKVRVEYSNEVWNGSFRVRRWLEGQAKADWGVERGSVDYHVKRATEVMRIWRSVFGHEAKARLVKVLGAQAANDWLTTRLLSAEMWKAHEPGAWAAPGEIFDELAIASYFGGRETVDEAGRAALLSAIRDPQIDANAYVLNLMRDKDHTGSVPNSLEAWKKQAILARKAGLRLVAYEGGQHLHHSFAVKLSKEDQETLTAFFGAFVRSPEMAELYQDAWNAWTAVGQGPFMQFTDIGRVSKWGSWGLRQYLDDTPPRAALLDRLNAQTAPWWRDAKGGPWYQQGITQVGTEASEMLIGTEQEDYLIGKAGHDVFRGGPEDDGLHGGEGTDRALFSGLQAHYRIEPEGLGYRVTGPDGSDLLMEIEEVQFDDTGPLTLEMLAFEK